MGKRKGRRRNKGGRGQQKHQSIASAVAEMQNTEKVVTTVKREVKTNLLDKMTSKEVIDFLYFKADFVEVQKKADLPEVLKNLYAQEEGQPDEEYKAYLVNAIVSSPKFISPDLYITTETVEEEVETIVEKKKPLAPPTPTKLAAPEQKPAAKAKVQPNKSGKIANRKITTAKKAAPVKQAPASVESTTSTPVLPTETQYGIITGVHKSTNGDIEYVKISCASPNNPQRPIEIRAAGYSLPAGNTYSVGGFVAFRFGKHKGRLVAVNLAKKKGSLPSFEVFTKEVANTTKDEDLQVVLTIPKVQGAIYLLHKDGHIKDGANFKEIITAMTTHLGLEFFALTEEGKYIFSKA